MDWYVAKAIFKSSIGTPSIDDAPLIDVTWFLVSAGDEGAAETKAIVLARSKEHSYTNGDGETVHWIFVRIERLRKIMDDHLGDGTEVWSVISPAEEAPQICGLLDRTNL